MPFVNPSFCRVWNGASHLTPERPFLTQNLSAQLAAIRSRNMQKSSEGKRQDYSKYPYTYRSSSFCNRERGGSSSSHWNLLVSHGGKNPASSQKNLSRRVLGRKLAVIQLVRQWYSWHHRLWPLYVTSKKSCQGKPFQAGLIAPAQITSLSGCRIRSVQYEESLRASRMIGGTTRLFVAG